MCTIVNQVSSSDEKDYLWGEFLSEASDAGSDESEDEEVMDVDEEESGRPTRKEGSRWAYVLSGSGSLFSLSLLLQFSIES